jgi:RNA polymerase sigma-70 factor (ECF subfamily)
MIELRTNEQWLDDLNATGPRRDAALADLRAILTTGLQRGLVGRVDTTAPEFDALTEDFVQEALLKILDSSDSFAGRSQFTTWAHKIALNVALSELRRKRWKDSSLDQLTDTEDGDYTPSFVADTSPTPEDRAERREAMRYVARILAEELTDRQRAALTAVVIQGKPLSEVAYIMDSNQNAMYKLLFDARRKLKQRLEADGLSSAEIIATFEQVQRL